MHLKGDAMHLKGDAMHLKEDTIDFPQLWETRSEHGARTVVTRLCHL